MNRLITNHEINARRFWGVFGEQIKMLMIPITRNVITLIKGIAVDDNEISTVPTIAAKMRKRLAQLRSKSCPAIARSHIRLPEKKASPHAI
jgi:hypothetical protein